MGYGLCVDIECRPAARVQQQFLSSLDVDAEHSQIRRQRMTEAVAADLFADDGRPN